MVFTLKGLGPPCFSFQVRVDFRLVGMVVRQSGMDLRQGQMAKLTRDFFRNKSHGVPLSNPANGNAGPGNARSTAANFGTSREQAAYFSDRCHRHEHIASRNCPGVGIAATELSAHSAAARHFPKQTTS